MAKFAPSADGAILALQTNAPATRKTSGGRPKWLSTRAGIFYTNHDARTKLAHLGAGALRSWEV